MLMIINIMEAMLKIIRFYIEGFRAMKLGKTLWLIIFIKLFIMFAILKVCFFPDYLQTNFPDDRARADYVLQSLTADY